MSKATIVNAYCDATGNPRIVREVVCGLADGPVMYILLFSFVMIFGIDHQIDDSSTDNVAFKASLGISIGC